MPGPGRRLPGRSRRTLMKKHETRKLSLNRETVRHLEGADLKDVIGGIVSSDNITCTYSKKCNTVYNC
jgi:hypothetical protein